MISTHLCYSPSVLLLQLILRFGFVPTIGSGWSEKDHLWMPIVALEALLWFCCLSSYELRTLILLCYVSDLIYFSISFLLIEINYKLIDSHREFCYIFFVFVFVFAHGGSFIEPHIYNYIYIDLLLCLFRIYTIQF